MSRRRTALVTCELLAAFIAQGCSGAGGGGGEWPGVDDAVVGRFVREAGRSGANPVIDWVKGDSLLFAFLCAGLVAGFVLGFFGRAVFAERLSSERKAGKGDG